MVETSFDATRRLLDGALESCEDPACRFRVRTALQMLTAMESELEKVKADLQVFESAIAENPELESALADLDVLEE